MLNLIAKKRYYYWVVYRYPVGTGSVGVDTQTKIDSVEKLDVIRDGIIKKHLPSLRPADLLIINWKLLRHA